MAFAAPKPEDRLAFADELAQVRAALAAAKKQVEKNVYRKYKKELNEIEVEYQFILLRSLTLFHKEMLRSKLPDRLYEIKENLTDTGGSFSYQTNLPDTNWNWNNIICKQCHKNRLTPMPGTNELCCKICGALETLDGAYFEAKELHKCGDFKIVKQRSTRRKYSFRCYMEKHRKIILTNGHTLSVESINKTNEIFDRIEKYLPKRISTPFVAYKILSNVVQSEEEKYVLNYFLLQVPQSAVAKHACKWDDMLKQFDA